jgi:hypothetical protein
MEPNISTEELNRALHLLRNDKYTFAETASMLGVPSKLLVTAICEEAASASERYVIDTMNRLHGKD